MSALISLVRRTLPCYFQRDELHESDGVLSWKNHFCNTPFGSFYILYISHLVSDQEKAPLGSSGPERDFVDATLPLFNVLLLFLALRRPEDQMQGIISGRRRQ